MKIIFSLILFFFLQINVHSQQKEEISFSKNDVYLSFVAGHKTHVGTFGLSGNYFFSKNFTAKLSLGHGASSYNGAIFTIGSEIYFSLSNKVFMTFGLVWTKSSGHQDIIGDDDSPDYFWFHTSKTQYLRPFICVGLFTEPNIRLEIGYSHALRTGNYSFSGPGFPNSSQINRIKNGLGSGLGFSIAIGLFDNIKK